MLEKEEIKKEPTVYLLQEIPGTSVGRPKFNIMVVLSAGPVLFELRKLLRDIKPDDYLLLTGDPSIIFLVGPIVHYYTGGKINLLKWDRQEKVYYPVPINFNEKGEINE